MEKYVSILMNAKTTMVVAVDHAKTPWVASYVNVEMGSVLGRIRKLVRMLMNVQLVMEAAVITV